MIHSHITSAIISCAYKVHQAFGPGLLESAYQRGLIIALRKEKLKVEGELAVDIEFESNRISNAFKIDLLVEDCIVVELKSVQQFSPVHFKQLLTYLKLGNYPVGLLINFHQEHLKNGVRRIDNKMFRPL